MPDITQNTQTDLEADILIGIRELGHICQHPERLPEMQRLASTVQAKFISYVDNARLLTTAIKDTGKLI
jgi:hypothetical protein